MKQLLEAMRKNPAGNWRIGDIQVLCDEHGLTCSPPRGGGSHYKVAHPAIADMLSIPFARPIKSVYIRKLVQMVDAVSRA